MIIALNISAYALEEYLLNRQIIGIPPQKNMNQISNSIFKNKFAVFLICLFGLLKISLIFDKCNIYILRIHIEYL